MSLLRGLQQQGALRPLDVALTQSLKRLDDTASDAVLAAAALASLAVSQGHAGFDLAQPQMLVEAALAWPGAQAWAQELASSPLVVTPLENSTSLPAPLVLEKGLLYLRRYREYEYRLAQRLRQLASALPEQEAGAVAGLFAQLFPNAQHGDLQACAAELALRKTLLLLTGGPGTGKTTTIAKLLVLRIAQAVHAKAAPLRIALAAPTGRAADRMAESLQRAALQMAEQGVDSSVLAQLPERASTLHRLLGVIPDTPQFRHHASNPLPFDIIVVDEASMVDLPLMSKLTEAVAEGCQLILLGDADQLPSVEAGDVLAAILAAESNDTCPLHGHRVQLQHSWRQGESLQLAPLAEAMRQGDSTTALALLRGDELAGVYFHEEANDPLRAHPQLLEHWRALATFDDPRAALREVNRMRLLTALREGPQGSRQLNANIEARLSGQRLGSAPAWFPGRLLLVVENSYRHGLFNGDVGICLPDATCAPCVWFSGGEDGVRRFHPAALPAHESAFAMTVHKAQGSEFDEVYLQLPQQDARVLSRELLYTGITRARRGLHLAANADVLTTALMRHASRVSGVAWRLAAEMHFGRTETLEYRHEM